MKADLLILTHILLAVVTGGLCWHIATDYAELNNYRKQAGTIPGGNATAINRVLDNALTFKGAK